MNRLVLCGFGALAALALSCQVLPGAASMPASASSGGVRELHAVDAGPPQPSLADTVAVVEGTDTLRNALNPVERRIIEHLSRRHTGLSHREIREVARTIVAESAAHEVEITLVLAVIQVESAGYHRAVSSVGALGLMQIMPATGKGLAREHGIEWRGPKMLFDPVLNVKLGIAYLGELSDRYDHVPTALAAYNWGPGKIDSRIRRGVGMPQLYIEQVRKAAERVERARLGDTASS